jgi:hypothetical protein
MKKAKGKIRRTAEKPAKKRAPKTKKPVDIARVRENIANLVGGSAELIAARVIKVAKRGQLAPAKYLFEVVGVYPATEETTAKPEDSMAYTLLSRMGLPTEPVVCDEDPLPAAVSMPSVAEEDPGDDPKEEQEAVPEGEE